MSKQTANTVLMVRPVAFGYNEETALTNAFQQNPKVEQSQAIQDAALLEFERMQVQLNEVGIQTVVIEDTKVPSTPDSIFPNNWISFHPDGTVVLYPMMAANRRQERRKDIVELLEHQKNFKVNRIIDLTHYEKQDKFLEGTGSLIFDYEANQAYANLSSRTHREIIFDLAEKLHFTPIVFHSLDRNGKDIYHTNVVMCLGDKFAIICLESIPESDREQVSIALQATGKEIIDISYNQLYNFAGNMLQLKNLEGQKYLVISKAAYDSLHDEQLERLMKFNQIIKVDIQTIEKYGGGSVRCMLAAVHLPRK